MNKLLQTWQRMPDWLKGAGLGVLTYVIPFVLCQVLFHLDWKVHEWWKEWLWALLIATVHPLHSFSDMSFAAAYALVPLVWALLGAFFSKIWGVRRGCIILLVLESIIIIISGLTIFVLMEWLRSF